MNLRHIMQHDVTILPLCRLNLPACLPDMYVRMTEPKCILGRETPKVIDREQMCKNNNIGHM